MSVQAAHMKGEMLSLDNRARNCSRRADCWQQKMSTRDQNWSIKKPISRERAARGAIEISQLIFVISLINALHCHSINSFMRRRIRLHACMEAYIQKDWLAYCTTRHTIYTFLRALYDLGMPLIRLTLIHLFLNELSVEFLQVSSHFIATHVRVYECVCTHMANWPHLIQIWLHLLALWNLIYGLARLEAF